MTIHHQHHEIDHGQDRPLLPDILTAARQGAPWLVALIGLAQLAVIITVLLLLTMQPTDQPPTPHRLQETR
jgi:hypothetical protein